MFFALSKIFWFFVEPLNLVGFALAFGVALLAAGRRRIAMRVLAVTAVAYLLAAFGPIGPLLTRPLEDRFPRPAGEMVAPDAIIVLGGAMNEGMLAARGVLELNESGARMTEAVAVAQRFPQAKLVFSGGSASFTRQANTESDAARLFFAQMGVAPERCLYEDKSRNTFENAVFTGALLKPAPGQTFLLVTSAFHMPRSMGLFRKAGFNVVPWPSDYRTTGSPADFWKPQLHAEDGLRMTSVALREWIGLLAYRLTGKIDALLPGQ